MAALIPFTLLGLALFGVVLTAVHLLNVLVPSRARRARGVELTVYLTGIPLTAVLLTLLGWNHDWPEALVSGGSLDPMHVPVATWHAPTVLVLLALGLGALALLRTGARTPLVTVLCLAATYLASAVCVAWLVQVGAHAVQFAFAAPVCLVPLAFALSTIDVTRASMRAALAARAADQTWAPEDALSSGVQPPELQAPGPELVGPAPVPTLAVGRRPWLRIADAAERVLTRVTLWPLAAFVLAWPLWGLLTIILVLVGQRPDAAVQAFLATSDWTLSTRQSPPMVQVDQHYLCTVAAGGHRRLVRPERRGVRHGHEVVVNRQLCVANAFEDVLAERLPRTHRAVRGFYDRCGLPVARHVTTAWRADVVYLVMKPLEWLFLAVLYAADRHPERRIARQYLPGAPAPSPERVNRSNHPDRS